MKQILLTVAILFSLNCFSQFTSQTKQPYKIATYNVDTMSISVGDIKYIKIGDKVYKVETTLVEVQKLPVNNWILNGTLMTPTTDSIFHYYNGSSLLNHDNQSDLLWRGDSYIPSTKNK